MKLPSMKSAKLKSPKAMKIAKPEKIPGLSASVPKLGKLPGLGSMKKGKEEF